MKQKDDKLVLMYCKTEGDMVFVADKEFKWLKFSEWCPKEKILEENDKYEYLWGDHFEFEADWFEEVTNMPVPIEDMGIARVFIPQSVYKKLTDEKKYDTWCVKKYKDY